jgi:hypothetical protein
MLCPKTTGLTMHMQWTRRSRRGCMSCAMVGAPLMCDVRQSPSPEAWERERGSITGKRQKTRKLPHLKKLAPSRTPCMFASASRCAAFTPLHRPAIPRLRQFFAVRMLKRKCRGPGRRSLGAFFCHPFFCHLSSPQRTDRNMVGRKMTEHRRCFAWPATRRNPTAIANRYHGGSND